MSIQKALKAAMSGPEITDIRVFGHDWNVKQALVTVKTDTITVKGWISHNVKITRDDQISYEFIFKQGKIVKSDINIDEKGWASIAAKVISVVSQYLNGGEKVISSKDILPLTRKVENMAVGDWQTAGQQLALRIGLEGYRIKSKATTTA